MAEGPGGEDRTESATPRRLQRARESGQAPVSHELSALVGLGVFAVALAMVAPTEAHSLALRLSILFRRFDLGPAEALRLAALAALAAAAPVIAAALLAAAAAVLLQTGFLLSLSPLAPDLSRLSPAAGLRRMVGVVHLVEGAKALAKLAAMGITVWFALRDALPRLWLAPFRDPSDLAPVAAGLVLRVLVSVLAVQAAIAIVDLVWMRVHHARGLRMSREEVREEQRESDGDPKIKARIRQIRLQRARRRMLAAVPKATVVVTNPTHYAVALAYDRGKSAAPRVVAKGVDSMAARIRETAAAHGVPLVANPPLARALHKLAIDAEIPPEHYKAVAELIAYVWRLGARSRPAAPTALPSPGASAAGA
jgi:flagellar biosynthetic protein FlhB